MTKPSATSDSIRMAFVLLGWAMSVAVGWLLGDWDRIIFNESWRSMHYPLNLPSPAFAVILLSLVIYLRGAALYLGGPQSNRRGFWILSISALCGGVFTFLTAVAVTVVLRSV